jgi:hypothetical protein
VAAGVDLKIMEEKDEETITILSRRRRHCCLHHRNQASAIAAAAIPMRACREAEAAMQPAVLGGRMTGASPLAVILATSDEGLPEEDNLTVRRHGKIPTRLVPAIADHRGMRQVVKLVVGAPETAVAGGITAVPAPQDR